MNPVDQAKQDVERAREYLGAVESEAAQLTRGNPGGLLPRGTGASLAERWQNTIAAAQAHATLATAETLGVVVDLLEVLAAPAQPLRTVVHADAPFEAWVPTRADERIEWQWWQDGGEMGGEMCGEWVAAASEDEADELAARQYWQDPRTDPANHVRSRVVGPWSERPAR